MNKIDTKKVMERHKSMLEYQKKIYPFTPTLKELQALWKLNTTSAVVSSIHNLEREGLIISRERGRKTFYYAIG